MARYEIIARAFIAGQLIDPAVTPGLIVTVPDDFVPGQAYSPVDDAAIAAYKKYEANLPSSLRPRQTAEPLEIQIEDPGPDAASKEVDFTETLAGSAAVQAKPGPTEAPAKK